MMGYAESPATSPAVPRWASCTPATSPGSPRPGCVQVVGRLDRQAKVLGHRVDLDRVESRLADAGLAVRLVARPDCLWVFAAGARPAAGCVTGSRRRPGCTAPRCGWWPSTASGHPVAGSRTTPRSRAHVEREESLRPHGRDGPVTAEEVRDLLRRRARPPATRPSPTRFVGLGGDSLSYVEVSTRLGSGWRLPSSWPSLSAAELAALWPSARPDAGGVPSPSTSPWSSARSRSRWSWSPTSTCSSCRAARMCCSRWPATTWPGSSSPCPDRRPGARAAAQRPGGRAARRCCSSVRSRRSGTSTAGPPRSWSTESWAATGGTSSGSSGSSSPWSGATSGWPLLLAVPLLTRAQRAAPFGSALWSSASRCAALRLDRRRGGGHRALHARRRAVVRGARPLRAVRADPRQTLLVAGLAVVATAGFFGDREREAIVVAGVLLLLVRLPRCGCLRGPPRARRAGVGVAVDLPDALAGLPAAGGQRTPGLGDRRLARGRRGRACRGHLGEPASADVARAAPVLRRGRPFGARLNGVRVAAR